MTNDTHRALYTDGVLHTVEDIRSINTRTQSINASTFLGLLAGPYLTEITITSGEVLDPVMLRTTTNLDLTQVILRNADIALLRGVLSHNPHLDPNETFTKLEDARNVQIQVNARMDVRHQTPGVSALIRQFARLIELGM